MLVPADYIISYEQRSLSQGEAWPYHSMITQINRFQVRKTKTGIKAVTATIYYSVHHYVMNIIMTCSNAKDNIYFVIIFSQLLRNDDFSWLR